ncbi:hypothetical protein ColTof4_11858 [Colletotrichum tofieldiae]|nr:hypothetical protein ColTof4_11858 [Colletotrichum tofieldiae]
MTSWTIAGWRYPALMRESSAPASGVQGHPLAADEHVGREMREAGVVDPVDHEADGVRVIFGEDDPAIEAFAEGPWRALKKKIEKRRRRRS